jgi:endonuclease/exonuclease/phosphatase family metal-dependent hydrolase
MLGLRISTWNCFGMGQGLSAIRALRAPFAERFRDPDVLAECASADVLCLQELLSGEAQRFFDGVGRFISRFRDDNRPRFGKRMTMRGCGLGIGARSQLTGTHVRRFRASPVGWDRFASKGALYAQLSFPQGVKVDLITVHLQAGRGARAAAARAKQLVDVRAFVDSVGSPARPFMVCGDFNIDGLEPARGASEYRSLTTALRGFQDLGAVADRPTYDPRPHGNALAHAFDPAASAERIDYIFFRPARGPVDMHCTRLDVIFDKPLPCTKRADGTAAWASDHFGLCASFELGGRLSG